MKKLLALVLALAMAFALAACGDSGNGASSAGTNPPENASNSTPADGPDVDAPAEPNAPANAADLKIGCVLVGDENEGYTYAHIKGIEDAIAATGIPAENVIMKYSIPENESCYDAAIDLVEQGCSLVISNSYGHQTFIQQAAADCPDVTFVACTGDTANQANLPNFKNAFTAVYQSRYVSGVVAGMKVAELVANNELSSENFDADGKVKIGYVGAYPYAEVVSGYTAFFLGIQSVYPDVSMEVTYTNSWFDITAEATAAESLMADGCVIIGQHADSTGAPAAVQAAWESGTVAYSVGYNIDMLSVAADAALTSSTNNWGVFYTYAFNCMLNGEEIATDWCEGYESGTVAITALGQSCAEGTAEKVAEVEEAIHNGELNVFDCSTFTVGGEHPTSILIDMDGDFTGETEGVVDGVFQESTLRSAPGFTARIDGITELN